MSRDWLTGMKSDELVEVSQDREAWRELWSRAFTHNHPTRETWRRKYTDTLGHSVYLCCFCL